MTVAQIDYRTEAGRTTYTYRQRIPLIAPRAWLWSAIGGVAIGLAGAVANAVLVLAPDLAFRTVLIALSIAATVLLFILVRLATRTGDALRVSFDVLAGTVDVYRRGARPATTRYTLTEIAGFETLDQATNWQHSCMLLMHTVTQQHITLLIVDRDCIPRTGLAEFAARLNMARDAALDDMRAVPPRPVQQPYIAPTAQRPAIPTTQDDRAPRSDMPPAAQAVEPERDVQPPDNPHPHHPLRLPHIAPQLPDNDSEHADDEMNRTSPHDRD